MRKREKTARSASIILTNRMKSNISRNGISSINRVLKYVLNINDKKMNGGNGDESYICWCVLYSTQHTGSNSMKLDFLSDKYSAHLTFSYWINLICLRGIWYMCMCTSGCECM